MSKTAVSKKLITLYVNDVHDQAFAVAQDIAAQFRARGYDIAVCKGQDRCASLATNGARPEEAGLFITVGGDGTLLRAARLATQTDTPLLGINTGRLGFLTELDEGDPRIARLPEIVDEGLLIDERLALEAEWEGKTYFALNEVVVRKGDVSRVVPFGLSLDNEHIAHVPADGVCVATPTGSTAYFLSAGGPIISPRVDAFGIVPLLPHALFSRPLIVPATSRIEISCGPDVQHAHLECDGSVLAEMGPNTNVMVRRYPRRVKFARISPLRFFERLEEKMRWGVSVKAPSR